MKRITAFVLLACLFFMTLGYHFVFYFRIQEAKSEMSERLRQPGSVPGFQQLVISREQERQLDWENDHEFRFQGKMYDVVAQQRNESGISFRCLADEQETEAVNKYLHAAGPPHSPGSSPLNALVRLMNMQFLEPGSALALPPQSRRALPYAHYTALLAPGATRILLPPPELA